MSPSFHHAGHIVAQAITSHYLVYFPSELAVEAIVHDLATSGLFDSAVCVTTRDNQPHLLFVPWSICQQSQQLLSASHVAVPGVPHFTAVPAPLAEWAAKLSAAQWKIWLFNLLRPTTSIRTRDVDLAKLAALYIMCWPQNQFPGGFPPGVSVQPQLGLGYGVLFTPNASSAPVNSTHPVSVFGQLIYPEVKAGLHPSLLSRTLMLCSCDDPSGCQCPTILVNSQCPSSFFNVHRQPPHDAPSVQIVAGHDYNAASCTLRSHGTSFFPPGTCQRDLTDHSFEVYVSPFFFG